MLRVYPPYFLITLFFTLQSEMQQFYDRLRSSDESGVAKGLPSGKFIHLLVEPTWFHFMQAVPQSKKFRDFQVQFKAISLQ